MIGSRKKAYFVQNRIHKPDESNACTRYKKIEIVQVEISAYAIMMK